jgi:hypothetical protein
MSSLLTYKNICLLMLTIPICFCKVLVKSIMTLYINFEETKNYGKE